MPRAFKFEIALDEQQRDRFWSRVCIAPSTTHQDCWLWTGQKDGFGYGMMKVRQRPLRTHRIAWTLMHGPIPGDRTLDHLCRNPACVNPSHLELVTNKENILRGTSPQAVNAAKTKCPKHGCDYTYATCPSRSGLRECPICMKEKAQRQTYRRKEARHAGRN